MRAQTRSFFILPREAGKGDRAQRGGRGDGKDDAHRASGRSARPLHHASHGPPPPLRFAPRGRITVIVLATRSAPEFCEQRPVDRSPDGAKRNPGTAWQLECSPSELTLALLRATNLTNHEKKGKRNADKRVSNLRVSGAARTVVARGRVRSPVGVPPRLLRQRANADAQLQARLPGTRQDARSGKLAPTGERRPRAVHTGVTRARLSQSRERTSQTGHSAGRMMPKAAPARIAKPRGSTALAPCSGVPREHDPLSERDSMWSCTGFGDHCQ